MFDTLDHILKNCAMWYNANCAMWYVAQFYHVVQ